MITKTFENRKVMNCYFAKVAKNPQIEKAFACFNPVLKVYTVEYEYKKNK